jgi:hypothetical protein
MWTARGREKAGNQTVEDELLGTIPQRCRVLVPSWRSASPGHSTPNAPTTGVRSAGPAAMPIL